MYVGMCHACMGTVLHTVCMHYPTMFNKEDMYTMHIYHYLCLMWYGQITTITMACTMREVGAAHTLGYTIRPDANGIPHCH